MSVQFDEPPIVTSVPAARHTAQGPSITDLLKKAKIARTDEEANMILWGAFALLVLSTVLMLWLGLSPSSPPPEDPLMNEQPMP